MKVYTKAEFDCHCLESTKLDLVDYNFQGFDEVGRNVNKLFDFGYKSINFSSGVELNLSDELITCDHNVANEHNSDRVLTSKFYLSGHHGVISPNIENVAAEYIEKADQNYLMYLPNIEEIEQFFTNPLKKIVIRLDLNFIHSFVSQLDSIPQPLQSLIEKDN